MRFVSVLLYYSPLNREERFECFSLNSPMFLFDFSQNFANLTTKHKRIELKYQTGKVLCYESF